MFKGRIEASRFPGPDVADYLAVSFLPEEVRIPCLSSWQSSGKDCHARPCDLAYPFSLVL